MKNNSIIINNEAIGQRVRGQREKLRLTREEFAEMIELSPLYLGQLERGERQMSLSTLVRVSSWLHVTTDFLIYGDSDESKKEKNRIINLLDKCTNKELLFVEEMIKLLLSHIDNEN